MSEDVLNVLQFSIIRFIFLFIITLYVYYSFAKNKSMIDKFSLFVIICLIFIYSGIGASFSIVPTEYIFFYVTYIFFFSFSFSKTAFVKFISPVDTLAYDKIMAKLIINKRISRIIIYLFICLSLLNALYPGFNILRLFILKKPELIFDLSEIPSRDLLQSLLYYILMLLQPFYFISLSTYKDKSLKFFIALFLPIYFSYTLGGYVARSTLIPYFAIFIVTMYVFNEKYRRIIVWLSIISFIPILLLLYYFTIWRAGDSVATDMTNSNALISLFAQEATYPLLYKTLSESSNHFETINFFKWLFTLPIPSFLKGSSYSIYINYEFTEIITGQSRDSSGFSVLLPGVVTESFFIFGKYFNFIMPLITGWLLGSLYRMISSNSLFFILKLYFILMLFPLLARAGGGSALPIIVNSFMVFYLVLFWVKRVVIKRNHKYSSDSI